MVLYLMYRTIYPSKLVNVPVVVWDIFQLYICPTTHLTISHTLCLIQMSLTSLGKCTFCNDLVFKANTRRAIFYPLSHHLSSLKNTCTLNSNDMSVNEDCQVPLPLFWTLSYHSIPTATSVVVVLPKAVIYSRTRMVFRWRHSPIQTYRYGYLQPQVNIY